MPQLTINDSTLRKLARLHLIAGQVRSGAMKGERRSIRRGSSLEFADYRPYTPGDDLRRLDWNIYARLDRPYLKLYEDEEDLAVYLLIDASRSMDWGAGEQNKFGYALHLAAALAAVALADRDALSMIPINDSVSQAAIGPLRGSLQLLSVLGYLETLVPSGRTLLANALLDLTRQPRRPGLVFLISDLFTEDNIQDGLSILAGHGDQVILLHLLTPDELNPALSGDLRLVDIETSQEQDISLDSAMLQRYQERLAAWQEELRSTCQARGARYIGISTAQPWEKVVLEQMRAARILR